jgi:magnesium-transporting ATPase (P-type)
MIMKGITTDASPFWHDQSSEAALRKLETTPTGLSQTEAEARLATYGPNRLPEPPRRSVFIRFLLQFHNILIYVLLGSAVITAFLEHWVDTLVILAVVIANAVIGFIQEGKAEKAMDAIRQMLAPHASVLRGGERRSVAGDLLVPGDIVLLEAGDKVPADLRLLQAHGMSVQEAILTGESVPVEKHTAPVAAAPLGDRSCMAFSGTLVASGQGKGIVVATGAATEIGRISRLLSEVETLTTPLVKQMGVFAKWLTILILLIAALLLVFGYFVEHHDFSEMFMAVVGLSVAAIPEGLPAILTITLAIGVQAMARRNAIMRRLPAIETLGSVSVICTDKTGTLTRNEMMVASVATHVHLFTLDGIGYEPTGVIRLEESEIKPGEHAILDELARTSALCNDASLREHEGVWTGEGDPMEGALLAFSGKTGLDVRQELSTWTRTDTIPFDAKHRFMATLNHDHEDQAFVLVKGAPERILSMCKDQRSAMGGAEPLNEAYWREGADAIATLGQRVLADDNFASIAAAVREGRTVYDNLKKVISWTLPTNAGEAMTIIVALLFGMTLPVTPIQILWINLITAVTLGIALAFEPTEENTMRRPPRPRREPLLTGELAWHIVLVSTLFVCGVFGIYAYAIDRGYSEELARTIALNTLVVMEIFHLFFIRNIYGTSLTWKAVRGTKVVWAVVGVITVAQFAITYLPSLQTIFATQSIPFLDGVLIVGVGVALFVLIETEKQIRLRLRAMQAI